MYFRSLAVAVALCASSANAFSVSPAGRGLAFNKAPVASTALSMSEVADAAVATTAEEVPAVMRPPIDMPWESVSEQVRITMFRT